MNKILSKIVFLSAIAIALPFFVVNAEESALSISCGPSNSKVMIGENVTWTANVSGGTTPYSSFEWSSSSLGSSSISGDSESTTMTYDAAGSYGAQFTVIDGDFMTTKTVECSRVQVVAPLEFVSCGPSPVTGNTGYETIWKVVVKGGVAPYSLNISGDEGLTGTGVEAKVVYTTAGTKNATVTNISSTFDSGPLAGPFTCASATIYSAPTELTATCSADDSSIKEGESVTWSASVSGGTAPYTYSWSGTDSLSGSGATASKTYSAQGTKSATLDVMDSVGTEIAGISCSSVTVSEKTTTTSGSGGGSGSGSSRSSRTSSSTSTNATTTTRTVVAAEVPVNTVTFANNTGTANRPVVANNAGAKATTTVATATSTDEGIKQANLLASAGAFGFIKDNKITSIIVALLILGLAWFIIFFKRRNKEEETPKVN